ncbi:hypothetical protein [Agrobacterium sp. MCAB5]|uniref:hypothetical protein n=1 Tax=Agrobacterium sp. MCAB5 TaxID=3233042 RepID=UPI003F911B84
MSVGPKYTAYQTLKRDNAEVLTWLAHIGKKGRHTDVLSLSVAHATVKLVVAGQYSEGGQNYWDSPKAFNALLLKYVHDHFEEISAAIVSDMEAAEARAKAATKDELQAALDELDA